MSKKVRNRTTEPRQPLLFGKKNYQLMSIGIALIFIGFVIMRLENEVHGFISLYISPLLIVGGFAEIIYAVMVKDESTSTVESGKES